jgi:hypothetical protein
MQESKSKFVISVDRDAKTDVSSYHHYRCDCMFKRLTAWLQAHGVEDRNALHTLRKEFGTQINCPHGLFAASAALRHASIQLTRAVYIAKKDRAVFAMPSSERQNQSFRRRRISVGSGHIPFRSRGSTERNERRRNAPQRGRKRTLRPASSGPTVIGCLNAPIHPTLPLNTM